MEENSVSAKETEAQLHPMRLGLFLGCIIPTEQYAYELSLRKLMPELGIELVDLKGFSCCGAPLRSINLNLSMYLAFRNLAICDMAGLDMLAPCPICHLMLTEAMNLMKQKECAAEQERYKSMLAEEGLEFSGKLKLYNTLDLLHDVIGLDTIAKRVVKPLPQVDFACHYGCHLIRPKKIGRPDDSEHPEKLGNILKVLGAQAKDYPEKLNCCGGPLILNLPDSALTKTGQKLHAVQAQNFAGLVDTCPWGHRLFDTRQKDAADTVGEKLAVPVFYITQLVGLALGIAPDELGLNLNLSPVTKLEGLDIGEDAPAGEQNASKPRASSESTAATEPSEGGGC